MTEPRAAIRRTFKRAVSSAATCAALCSLPAVPAFAQANATDGPVSPPAAASAPAVAATAAPAAAAAPLQIEVDNPEKLKGLKRVVIPSFNVQFMTEAKADVQINGIQVLTGAPSNVVVRLKGAEAARLQAIADALYAQTEGQLRAAGIEVVPLATLKAHPAYAELVERGDKAPKEEDAAAGKGVFHTAHGLPLLHIDETAFIQKFEIKLFGGKKPQDTFLPLSTKIAAGFSQGFVQNAESRLARELDAALLKVRLTVMGGTLEVGNNFWTGKEISARASASLPPMVNRWAFVMPNGDRSRIALKALGQSSELGEMVNVTPAVSQAADVARNVLNVAMILGGARGVGYGRSAEYEWRVQGEAYERVIDAQGAQVAEQFGAQLKGLLN